MEIYTSSGGSTTWNSYIFIIQQNKHVWDKHAWDKHELTYDYEFNV